MKHKFILLFTAISLILFAFVITGCVNKDYKIRIRKSFKSEKAEWEIGTYTFSKREVEKGVKVLDVVKKAMKRVNKSEQDYAQGDEEFLEWSINGSPCREYTYLSLDNKFYNVTMIFKESKKTATVQYFTKTSNGPASVEYVDHELLLPLTIDSYDDYVFIGWRENDEGAIIASYKFKMINGTKHKLYAYYIKRSEAARIVMLNQEDANPKSYVDKQVYETIYNPLGQGVVLKDRLEAPHKKNHKFRNWLLDGTVFDYKKDIVTKDMVLVPNFEPDKHKTLTFEDQTQVYQVLVFENMLIVDAPDFVIPTPAARENEEFICWTIKGNLDNKPYDFNQYLREDITLVPVFKKSDDTVFNVFLPNGVSQRIIRSASSTSFTIPFFEIPYYAFVGYYTDPLFTVSYSRFLNSPSTGSTVNLYPRYERILDLFTYEKAYDNNNNYLGLVINSINRGLVSKFDTLEIPRSVSSTPGSNSDIVGLSTALFKGLTNLSDVIMHPSLKIIEDDETFLNTPFFSKLESQDIIMFNKVLFRVKNNYSGPIPQDITYITKHCFYNNSVISEISIPESCLGLGEYAFRASNIKKVTLPSKFTKLPVGCFMDCSNLVDINTNELTVIEDDCFNGCLKLHDYTIKGDEALNLLKVKLFGNRAFKNCQALLNVSISPELNINNGLYFRETNRPVFGEELFRLTEFEYRNFNGTFSTNVFYHRDLLIVNGVLLQVNPERKLDIYLGTNTPQAYGRIEAINPGAVSGLANINIYLYPKDEHKDKLGVWETLAGAFKNLTNCNVYFPSDIARHFMANTFSDCVNTKAYVPYTQQTLPAFFEPQWDNSVTVVWA